MKYNDKREKMEIWRNGEKEKRRFGDKGYEIGDMV